MSDISTVTSKRYAQSVNGVVDLVGGEEVGLTCERTEPNVFVREDVNSIVQLGWLWDDETQFFVKPPVPPIPEPTPEERIAELSTVIDDMILNPVKDPEIVEIKTVLDDLILNGGAI